jgi:hypothetical protein
MPESLNNNAFETKEMVLQSLSFLVQERNKMLFRLVTVKQRLKELESEKNLIIKNNRLFKQRIINELDKHKNILTKDETNAFVEFPDE